MTLESILPIPDLYAAKRILCIQPHYDDNDIGAGGIIAQLAKKGAEVYYLTVSNDLMGVVDHSLSDAEALQALKKDQVAAAKLIGVKDSILLDYPDAGEYNYFDVRRDLLKHIRRLRPDLVFTCDPWLTYEGHRDHIQTGLASTEAVIFAGLTKIASSDPAVDASYHGHEIQGIVYYYTREPNLIADVATTWEAKLAAVSCYKTQFDPAATQELIFALTAKAQQMTDGLNYHLAEALKILHPSALHCGL